MADDNKGNIDPTDEMPFDEPVDNELSTDIDDIFDELSDDFDDFDGGVAYEPVQSASKSSSVNWFNIGIIGFVVAAIGGGIYMYVPSLFGNSETPSIQISQQPQQPAVDESGVADRAQEAVSQNRLDIIKQGGGILNNPDILLDVENQNNAISGDAVNTDELFQKIDESQSQADFSNADIQNLFDAIPLTQDDLPSPPVDDVGEIMNLAKQNDTPSLPTPSDDPIAMSEMVSMPELQETSDVDIVYEENLLPVIESPKMNDETMAVAQAPDDKDNMIAELNARIEELAKQVEALQNKIVEPSPSIDIGAVESKLVAIEQRIEAVAKSQQSKPQAAKIMPKAAPQKTKKYEPAYVPPPREKKPLIIWTLRGASPGQAVIVQQGTENIRTVNVGDSVDGLGRIQSVAIENGQWVVRGTSGTIKQ